MLIFILKTLTQIRASACPLSLYLCKRFVFQRATSCKTVPGEDESTEGKGNVQVIVNEQEGGLLY